MHYAYAIMHNGQGKEEKVKRRRRRAGGGSFMITTCPKEIVFDNTSDVNHHTENKKFSR